MFVPGLAGDVPAKLRRAPAASGQVSQASEERVAQLPGSGAVSRLRRGPGRWRGGDVQRLAAGPINRVSFAADPTQGLFQGRTPVLLFFLFFFFFWRQPGMGGWSRSIDRIH